MGLGIFIDKDSKYVSFCEPQPVPVKALRILIRDEVMDMIHARCEKVE